MLFKLLRYGCGSKTGVLDVNELWQDLLIYLRHGDRLWQNWENEGIIYSLIVSRLLLISEKVGEVLGTQ
jgi:hypothetical protein